MKRYLPGFLTLLVSSVALGVLIGNVFFGLYIHTVPPAMLTNFNKGTAHGAFLTYGAGVGVVMFIWGLLAVVGAKVFSRFGDKKSDRV